MTKTFSPARIKVRVPTRKWKSKSEVEEWARETLAGGPPKLNATVPPGHANSGEPATWREVQEGLLAEQSVEIFSDPPGLIVTDTDTGVRKFVPSASSTGLVLGKTSPDQFMKSIAAERALRDFVDRENDRFNKKKQSEASMRCANWTWEWYLHGKRTREFVVDHDEVSTERVWRELVNWGLGRNGYGRQTHQDSTYFYDWIGEAEISNPVFRLSTTRIQHILRDRTRSGRDLLLAAIVAGPLSGLTDDEFAWLLNRRKMNWPLDEPTRLVFVEIGAKIHGGLPISSEESARLQDVLHQARRASIDSQVSQKALSTVE